MSSLSESQISEFSTFAETLADAAAGISLQYFRQNLAVTNKAEPGHFDPVTEADRGAEEAIRALINDAYPHHGVLGEEHGTTNHDAEFVWVLDPIDGTRAFISGVPLWGTLIGLSHKGKAVIGICDQPYIGERFLGTPHGACVKRPPLDQTLSTSLVRRLEDATFSTTMPELFTGSRSNVVSKLYAQSRLTRYGYDCYAYCLVAHGLIDVVVETDLKPYDIQALIPIIENAGGKVTTWSGGRAEDGGNIVAAATEELHQEVLDVIASCDPD